MVRAGICARLKYLGLELDDKLNQKRGMELRISTALSNIPVWVVPTNEELAIARETLELVEKKLGVDKR